jgi:hypothetical protein
MISVASSSTPTTIPWVNYSVWSGNFGHWKYYWDNLTPDGSSTIGGAAFGTQNEPIKGLPVLADLTDKGTFIIRTPSNISSLIAQSLHSMLPAISSEISGLNSVFELKDVLSLKKIVAAAGDLGQRISRFVIAGKLKKGTLRSIVRYASNQKLVNSFAIDPFVADIAAIYKVMETVDVKINNILVEEGKTLKRHFSVPLRGFVSGYDESMTGTTPSGAKFRLTRDTQYINPRFRATVSYSYKLTQFEREHARILGLLDALGANWDPSIIWNAIPFSFVVDWLVKVDRWLENFKLNNLEPTVELYSYVWSIEMAREVKLGITPNRFGQPTLLPDPMHTHTFREDLYKRVSESRVNMYRELEVSGLSLKELNLALALAFA